MGPLTAKLLDSIAAMTTGTAFLWQPEPHCPHLGSFLCDMSQYRSIAVKNTSSVQGCFKRTPLWQHVDLERPLEEKNFEDQIKVKYLPD